MYSNYKIFLAFKDLFVFDARIFKSFTLLDIFRFKASLFPKRIKTKNNVRRNSKRSLQASYLHDKALQTLSTYIFRGELLIGTKVLHVLIPAVTYVFL